MWNNGAATGEATGQAGVSAMGEPGLTVASTMPSAAPVG